jgi:hypothetical protein
MPVLQRLREYPFHRSVFGGIIQSVCTSCLQTVAYSPRPDVLTLAEKAHKCSGRPQEKTKFKLV